MTITASYSPAVTSTVSLPIGVSYSPTTTTTTQILISTSYSAVSFKTIMEQVGVVIPSGPTTPDDPGPTTPDDPGSSNYTFGALEVKNYIKSQIKDSLGIIYNDTLDGRSLRRLAALRTMEVTIDFKALTECERDLVLGVLGTVFTFDLPDGGDILGYVKDNAKVESVGSFLYDIQLKFERFL